MAHSIRIKIIYADYLSNWEQLAAAVCLQARERDQKNDGKLPLPSLHTRVESRKSTQWLNQAFIYMVYTNST
jgi:hypothetical protein